MPLTSEYDLYDHENLFLEGDDDRCGCQDHATMTRSRKSNE